MCYSLWYNALTMLSAGKLDEVELSSILSVMHGHTHIKTVYDT